MAYECLQGGLDLGAWGRGLTGVLICGIPELRVSGSEFVRFGFRGATRQAQKS